MGFVSYLTINGNIHGQVQGIETNSYSTDPLGSVRRTIGQTGTSKNAYYYKPYGDLFAKTGMDADPRFLWLGANGYNTTNRSFCECYVRSRHYCTTVGIWGSVDPLWPQESGYVYVGANPSTSIDFYGMRDPRGPLTPEEYQRALELGKRIIEQGGSQEQAKSAIAAFLTSLGFYGASLTAALSAILAALIIALGVYAIYDLGTWACTGKTGLLTGLGVSIGTSIGSFLYPPDTEPEIPRCRKGYMEEARARADRVRKLKSYYRSCVRIKSGSWGPAKNCLGGGGRHQTDVYRCKLWEGKTEVKVSASILCCWCFDNTGIHEYCYSAVHDARF